MPKNFAAPSGILSAADPGTERTKITSVASNAAARITWRLCIAKKVNIGSRHRLEDFRLITAFLVIPGGRREDRHRPTLSADATSHSMKESERENQHAPLSYHDAWRIVWLVFLLIIIWLILRALQPVILLFALVFLLAMVLNPIVVWLRKHRVPRLLSVIFLILGLLAVAGTIVVFAIPPLSRQSQELMRNGPRVWQGIRTRIESVTKNYPAVREALPRSDEIAGKVGAAAGTVGSILLRSTIGLVGGVASIVFAILLLVFVLANPRPLVAAYLALAPDRYRDRAHRTLARLMRQMTAWARGVVINGVITGVSIGALLWLIGVRPALIFGVFAFLGEFLPNIGAFLVSIPILLVALSMGGTKFWLALGVIVLVYQIELNVLVPGVLGKEMRLHPVNILFFTLATATMFGLLGVFLAVPAAALVQIMIDEFYLRPRKPDYAAIDREAAALVEKT
jgi:putative permease